MRRLVVLAFLSSACANGPIPRLGAAEPAPAVADAAQESAYQTTLATYSRSAAIYDGLDTRLFAQATWQSPKFVEARLHRVASFKAMAADAEAKALSDAQHELVDATEFLLAVHANDPKHDDFDKTASMWRVVLVKDGKEYATTKLERVGRSGAEIRAYYPYVEAFWVGYRVRFPKVELARGETFTLKLASVVGKAELVFAAE